MRKIMNLIVEEKKRRYSINLPASGFTIRGNKKFFKELRKEMELCWFHLPRNLEELSYLGVNLKRDLRLKSFKICKN